MGAYRPLIPTPVLGSPAGLRNWSPGGRGAKSRDRAVVPSAAELVKQPKEIARLTAEGALTESELGSRDETALGRSLGLVLSASS